MRHGSYAGRTRHLIVSATEMLPPEPKPDNDNEMACEALCCKEISHEFDLHIRGYYHNHMDGVDSCNTVTQVKTNEKI